MLLGGFRKYSMRLFCLAQNTSDSQSESIRVGILLVQRLAQAIEVGIEGNESSRALEERLSPSFIRESIERTLPVAGCRAIPTG